MADLRWMTGTVSVVNQWNNGLQLQGSDQWYAYTKTEWRNQPFDLPVVGSMVSIGINPSDDGKLWIKEMTVKGGADIPFQDNAEPVNAEVTRVPLPGDAVVPQSDPLPEPPPREWADIGKSAEIRKAVHIKAGVEIACSEIFKTFEDKVEGAIYAYNRFEDEVKND